jgi:hypothetical protein
LLRNQDQASALELDVSERKVLLRCKGVYEADIALPYAVIDSKGVASFDKATRTLTLTLPVKPSPKASGQQGKDGVDQGIGEALAENTENDPQDKEANTTSLTPTKENHARWIESVTDCAPSDPILEAVRQQNNLSWPATSDSVLEQTTASAELASNGFQHSNAPAEVRWPNLSIFAMNCCRTVITSIAYFYSPVRVSAKSENCCYLDTSAENHATLRADTVHSHAGCLLTLVKAVLTFP